MKLVNKNYTINNLVRLSLLPMLAAFGMAAYAQQTQSSSSGTESKSAEKYTHTDAKFVKRAAMDNLQEIELGKLGQQKAQNQQLKEFSQTLVQDNQSANSKLQPIAQNLNVQLPQQLPSRWQSEITKLQGLSGSQFDKEFATYLLQDHSRDVNFYQREANRTQNADLKTYAQNTSQRMQTHLQNLESIAKNVGVDQNTIANVMKHTHATPTGREKGGGTGSGNTGSSDRSTTGTD